MKQTQLLLCILGWFAFLPQTSRGIDISRPAGEIRSTPVFSSKKSIRSTEALDRTDGSPDDKSVQSRAGGKRKPAFLWAQRSVSRRNLLKSARFHWEDHRLEIQKAVDIVHFSEDTVQDTLRVLGLRVEFIPDEDESSTGDGRFDLSFPVEPVIDPPPHDRAYFEDQMAALSAYYRTVSSDRLILLSEVSETVFVLPRQMADYALEEEEEINRGLVELFRDAVQTADASGLVFSGFDCFIVFHAGVGRDIALGFDPTPSDIPSVFLNLDDLQTFLGEGNPGYTGIPVENGSFFVQEGILLPETESQEGYEIGLLGTAALMFGFQLGLPALWDTQTGRSGIGRWGLMDQGSGNFNGLLPAHPCGWSKFLLGWENPVTLFGGENFAVASPDASNPVKLFRIPITESEYFLLENRQYDFDRSETAVGRDRWGETVTFLSDGRLEASGPIGVIVDVDEYDFGLPGSGILIWHIDETIIEENFEDNRINGNGQNRGVDLEEADGAQDIGEVYDLLGGGAGSELGVLHDAWFAENDVHQLVNDTDEISFNPNSRPHSRSNAGGDSHIVVNDFSDSDSVMTFSVTHDLIQPGFPADFGMGHRPYAPMVGDLDGDGQSEIMVATRGGKVFAWHADGTGVMESMSQGYRVSVFGDTVWNPVALFVDEGDGFTTTPVVGDIDGDDVDEVIAATQNGEIVRWQAIDSGGNGIPDNTREDRFNVGERVTALIVFDNIIVAGTESGRILYDPAGVSAGWEEDLYSGSIVGLCRHRGDRLVATTGDGSVFCFNTLGASVFSRQIGVQGELRAPSAAWFPSGSNPSDLIVLGSGWGLSLDDLGGEQARFGDRILPLDVSDPVLGDLDGDGFIEVLVTADGRIWAFNHNGTRIDFFPIPRYGRETDLSEPVLGDVSGDGNVDILVGTSEGLIEGFNGDGMYIDGFPLVTGNDEAVSPILFDVEGDGDIEVGSVSEDGLLFIWDLPGNYDADNIPWGGPRHDPAGSGLTLQPRSAPTPGETLMPGRTVYNYPNPTEGDFTTIRYRLERPARVTITIYDLGGERIDEFPGPGDAATENEFIWNLDGVVSGVYFCRVKAESGTEQTTVQIKIAVVK